MIQRLGKLFGIPLYLDTALQTEETLKDLLIKHHFATTRGVTIESIVISKNTYHKLMDQLLSPQHTINTINVAPDEEQN